MSVGCVGVFHLIMIPPWAAQGTFPFTCEAFRIYLKLTGEWEEGKKVKKMAIKY